MIQTRGEGLVIVGDKIRGVVVGFWANMVRLRERAAVRRGGLVDLRFRKFMVQVMDQKYGDHGKSEGILLGLMK